MNDETRDEQTCPVCGSKSVVVNRLPGRSYYVCNWCGYKFDSSKRGASQEAEKIGNSRLSWLANTVISRTGVAILGLSLLVLLFVSFSQGFTFWFTFMLVWVGMFLLLMLGLVVLAYALKFIIAGVVAIVIILLIYAFASGQKLLGLGILVLILAVIGYMMILGLLLILGLLAPALIAGLLVYTAMGMSTLAFFIAAITFVAIAAMTYLFVFRIFLPFILGYAICNAAGQTAYSLTTIGFSLDAVYKLVFEGQLFRNMSSITLNLSSVSNAAIAQTLIMVISVLSGVFFIIAFNVGEIKDKK